MRIVLGGDGRGECRGEVMGIAKVVKVPDVGVVRAPFVVNLEWK